MGRKHCHQIFVVARVVPQWSTDDRAFYRCIAAYNHKWCYGRLPLKATRRFLTLAKHAGNAEIIRAELASFQRSYGRYKCTGTPSPPDLACPYISFLLGTSSSVDLEDPDEAYGSGTLFMDGVLSCDTMPLASDEKVDSDGITVIDLTDPSNPAYCFMLPPNIDIPRVSVPSGVPLSATEYLRVYYPVPNSKDFEHAGVYEFEGLTRSTIDALREERIVTLEMLAEAWPDEYEAKLRESRKTEGGGDVAVTVAAADSDILIPSLVEMTMKPALRHSLEIGDTYDIEELVWMPGRGGAIKSLLRDQSPFPDTGVALLIKIIETEPTPDEAALDLTGFQLSAKQVLTVLSEVEHPVEILNLSDNIIITVDDIKHILLAIPSIRRLFLLGTSIPTEDLNKLLTDEPELFTNIEAIIHPAFLQWNGKGDASYPNAFAFVGLSFEPTFTLSFPFFTPSSIVKCLTDFLSGFTVQKFATYGLAKSTLVPQSAFASLRDEDKNWSERFVPLIPQGGSVLGQRRGWAFLFDFSMPPGEAPKPKKYAFVKLSAPGDDGSPRIHHFRSFLDELTREGRCRPFSIAINRLDDIFRRLGASLMTEEDVRPFAMGTDTDLLV